MNSPIFWEGEGEDPIFDECCELCGGPLPCAARACIAALQAQADYWEGEINQ